jgi:hypothetical protein
VRGGEGGGHLAAPLPKRHALARLGIVVSWTMGIDRRDWPHQMGAPTGYDLSSGQSEPSSQEAPLLRSYDESQVPIGLALGLSLHCQGFETRPPLR